MLYIIIDKTSTKCDASNGTQKRSTGLFVRAVGRQYASHLGIVNDDELLQSHTASEDFEAIQWSQTSY
jgi:hypothetical protein